MINPFKIIKLAVVSLVLILQSVLPASAEEMLQGWVVGVHDGDTVTLSMTSNRQIRIRLAQIDAPELDQPFGRQSRQSLSDMALNKRVLILAETIDKDGRTVGTIYANGLDVNREQIKRGMAWAYRQYLHDPFLVELERQARRARAGLWSDARPISPWRFRHGGGRHHSEPHGTSPMVEPASPPVPASCGEKRSCREMASCAEARFYLNQCDMTRLDADHDGVPCENVCGKGR